ncbi:LytR/AlgR family response regulator transcription factor [Chitinophaga silvisoli]|uniref:DNA-binding response regulator n=1 Tax=Chitinophaga silvisoli TaxID=2291814 RepID=A0A3E1P3T5_9BACT|nr:LytTR family DNA-binding domain-containing protein [Chitinophaga silvisoli]RFM34831.1 DNA-binding response regulator [Chitinophaga silvisoli]
MIIQAIAIDDELPALTLIANFCERIDFVRLQQTFNKPEEALQYIAQSPVDLLFLDINMPGITGTDFYKSITRQPMVIFTTAHSEYAVEGFNLNAVDYLLKPFTFERFQQAVQKAQAQLQYQQSLQKNEQQQLVLRVDYGLTRIALKDILFIEGLDDYLKIHLINQPPLVIRMTMKVMSEKLPAHAFVRVHRSYIVPLSKIDQVRNKTILIGTQEIPIGSSYEANFHTQFK